MADISLLDWFMIPLNNIIKTYKLVDQYLFHTEQSLKVLKFIDAKEIKL